MKTLFCLLAMVSIANAGSVWQYTDNENPCAGQVIIGNTGDNNPGVVIPAPDLNKEVIQEINIEPEVAPDHTYKVDDQNVESANPASPYNR